jgi:hypothetical protein
MDALLRKVVCLTVVALAMLLAADARSAPYSPAAMTTAVGSPGVGDALGETNRHTEVRYAGPGKPAKAPCPFCPKKTKTKACSTPPCPAWFGGPVPVAFAQVNTAYCLAEDRRPEGIDWPPDPPPPKTLI